MIDRAVGDDDVGPGGRGVHRGRGGLGIGAAALVDAVEDDGGSHRAGDVHVVQNQRHHRVGIVLGILAQVDGKLAADSVPDTR